MTKYFRISVGTLGLAALLSGIASAASGVKVIANPSVKADSISAEELKSVFLEERSSLPDGSRVEPVISKGGVAHETFVKQYLGKSEADLQTYYRSLVFTGKGSMPKMVASDTEIAAYVARTRGAIGYVSSETSIDGAKTLVVLENENTGSRKLISPPVKLAGYLISRHLIVYFEGAAFISSDRRRQPRRRRSIRSWCELRVCHGLWIWLRP